VVTLECVVRADGTPSDIRVIKPLHPELDEAASQALARWVFVAGTKDGVAVPVRVEVEMAFALRDDPPPARKGPALDSPEVFKPGKDVTTPVLIRDVKPSYSPAAIRARVQGSVYLECVVLPDGTVGDVRLKERLHPDLDEEAVRSLGRWTFKPGMKDGVAVPVQVDVEMSFTLGPRNSPKKP
jgi:TonB family protein